MSEVLVPYTEFGAKNLASQLSAAERTSWELLQARNLLGPVARYGAGLEVAEANVRKAQSEANPEHFAVVDEVGDVVGAASIYEGLKLRKVRAPVPAGIARRLSIAYSDYPYASHNIAAWTKPDSDEGLLVSAYTALADRFRSYTNFSSIKNFPVWRSDMRAWALEPKLSPEFVHESIAAAGLEKITDARFEAQESGRDVPPISTLYAHLQSKWSSVRGKLKELETGEKSFETVMDEKMKDVISANPDGFLAD